MTIRVIGLDIGGANLKAATWTPNEQTACAWQSFPLWKQPDQLGEAVRELITPLVGPHDGVPWLAITMTGELADCYETRRQGVERILQQIASVHPVTHIKVYAVGGRWLSPQQARKEPWRVAASNWHALASWLVQWPPCRAQNDSLWEHAVVVDIGSTTVDILPIVNGRMISNALTDRDRLESKQLVYTGMQRTPVCAIKNSFKLEGKTIPVMSELFATSDDVYLSLGLVEEQAGECDTADGRPRTAAFARARLARMIGEDIESLTAESIAELAQQAFDAQSYQVADAIEQNWSVVCQHETCASLHREITQQDVTHGDVTHGDVTAKARPITIVATGHGKPLLQRACHFLSQSHDVEATFLADHQLTRTASRCAPAAAVAWLLDQAAPSVTSPASVS